MIEAKFPEKLRGLQSGMRSVYVELFEQASPKFISPVVPDYKLPLNINNEAYQHQVSVFLTEIEQSTPFLKLKSYLGLYSAIDLSKLARFNDITETELIQQLLSQKNKSLQLKTVTKNGITTAVRTNVTDTHYYIDEGVLIINSNTVKNDVDKTYERFFVSGVKKHSEIVQNITKAFQTVEN